MGLIHKRIWMIGVKSIWVIVISKIPLDKQPYCPLPKMYTLLIRPNVQYTMQLYTSSLAVLLHTMN